MSLTPATREAALSTAFVEMADTLVRDFDVVDFLHSLAARSVALLDVDAAGIVFAGTDGVLHVIASSSEQARLLELFEVQNAEGPCLDAYRSGELRVEPDLTASTRWPTFSQEAINAGFNAAFAVPMALREQTIGALNLFRSARGSLPSSDLSIAQALADVATIGLLQERALREARVLTEQLQNALNSRIVIEQAKGVLAERLGLDLGDAFQRLRRYARNSNLHLADVANAVVLGTIIVGPTDE